MDSSAATARRLPDGDPPRPFPNVARLAAERVRDRGHAPYLTFYDDTNGERTELSYATFDNWVSKTANLLVEELEVDRGDRVVTLLGNHWTGVVVAFACWKAGCCVVPLSDDQAPGGGAALTASGARAAFVREDLVTQLGRGVDEQPIVAVGTGLGARLSGEELPGDVLPYAEEVLAFADDFDDPGVDLEDDALLVVPAEGLSCPAAVRLTQGNLLAAAEAIGLWGLARDDRLLCAQAASTDGLVLGHLGSFTAGASVVLTRTFDPGRLWRRVADERVTLLQLAAPHLARLEGSPPDGLRSVLVPAGASPAVLDDARRRVPVANGHGIVEATCASTLSPPGPDEETGPWLEAAEGREVGAVTARAAVTALDGGGEPVEHGVRGRLAVRGPVVMAGYDGRADLDEQVFSSGWFATDEWGFTDQGPDGRTYVFVTGPADEPLHHRSGGG